MNYSEITPYVKGLSQLSNARNHITPDLYSKYKVNKGLRDLNGKGVVTGLTEISTVTAKEIGADGNEIPCPGRLYYRGINIRDLVNGFMEDQRYGFEEITYLLLFSK
ncbi:MAG: citrate synthase, partial [Solobacterium sp.]|nr:citrate synthase [Solobacterium sp.]